MNRKDVLIQKLILNLKRILALAVFAAPCVLYLILLRRRAGDALLYTAPYQWLVFAFSLAAGIFTYIILRREKTSESDCGDDFSYCPEEKSDSSAPAVDIPELDCSAYPELFPDEEAGENDNDSCDISADISHTVSSHEFTPALPFEASEADRAWEEFSGDIKEEEFTYPKELYDNIPALPEDYEIPAGEEEEKEFSRRYTVRKPRPGLTPFSKAICILAAAALSLGISFAASHSLRTESETGFSDGGNEYLFSEVKSYTVSQKLLGSLSVEAVTENGKKTELFPATVFKGRNFSDSYDSIYAYMAHAVRLMRASGASESIEDREDIITSFRTAEDGTGKYIEEIIGEKLK